MSLQSFEYTRYKIGEKKGQPRLQQSCLDSKGQVPKVLAKAPKAGEQRRYEPLVGGHFAKRLPNLASAAWLFRLGKSLRVVCPLVTNKAISGFAKCFGDLSTIECEARSSVHLSKLVLGTSLTERRISCTTIESQVMTDCDPAAFPEMGQELPRYSDLQLMGHARSVLGTV
jgi:hypothetical protein